MKKDNTFSYILQTQKNVLLWMIVSFILFFLTHIGGLLVPAILRKTLDIYLPQKNVEKICQMILLIVLIPVLGTILNMLYNYLLAFYGRKYSQDLTNSAVEKVLSQPLNYYRNKNSAELASFCKAESYKAISILLFDIPQMTAKVLIGTILLLLLLKNSIWFFVIGIIGICTSVLPSNQLTKLTRKYIPTIVSGNAKMNQVLSESFREIMSVKSFQLEKPQLLKVNKLNKTIISVWAKTAMLDSLNGAWNGGLVNSLFYGLIFGTGATLALEGFITVGCLLESLGFISRLYDVTSTITKVNLNYTKANEELHPLYEILVLDEKEKIIDYKKTHHDYCSIVFNNVSFCYERSDENPLFQNVNLRIQPGEWIGIEGESGIGKSTFIYLLERFIEPSTGNIFINDKRISSLPIEEIRSLMTYIPQNPYLFTGTIRENLDPYGEGIDEESLWSVLEKVKLRKTIETRDDGLDTDVGEKGLMLSIGEIQRLAFARGLLRDTPILLLDEVTANVDEETENIIVKMLCEETKQEGKTIISIAHRPSFHKYATRTYRLSLEGLSLIQPKSEL